MADYRLTDADTVIRTSDGAYIPNDPANRDRLEYNEWLAAGGVPDPYIEPPPPVPQMISNRQFYQQLAVAELISQNDALDAMIGTIPAPINDMIAALPADQQFGSQMAFKANLFQRGDKSIADLQSYFEKSDDDMDGFFINAAEL